MAKTLRELFVDRARQLDAFQKMLAGQTPLRIMVLTAGPGMGKSWLIRTYAQAARDRGLPVAQFDFADARSYDALTLASRSRDQFGGADFARLDAAIAEATVARINLNLEGLPADRVDVNLSGATIGGPVTVNQGAVNVSDNTIVFQTNDPLIRRAAEDRINQAFFACLAELSATTRMVFLFDTYDRLIDDEGDWASSPTNRWIIDELLTRMRDGQLPNVIAVIGGRRAPKFGIEWNDVLGRIQLEPLTCDDITIYLRERRGLSIITDTEIERLCQAVAGNPSVLGIIGDNLEQANHAVKDDDW